MWKSLVVSFYLYKVNLVNIAFISAQKLKLQKKVPESTDLV